MKNGIIKIKNITLNPLLMMYIMVISAFFSQVSIFNEYIGIIRKIILIWGVVLLVDLFFKKKEVLKNKYSILLLAFCISNCISVIINFSNRFFYGVVTMEYVCIYLLIFFNITNWEERFGLNREKIFNNLMKIHILLSFIFAVIALFMFILNINGVYVLNKDIIYYGMKENRLWGLYNANTASTVCIISLICSIIQFEKNLHKKFLISNMIIQITYLILTQSRTGWILFLAFLVLYLMFAKILPLIRSNEKMRKKIGRCILYISIVIIIWECPAYVKKVLVVIPQTVNSIINTEECSDNEEKNSLNEDNVKEYISLERVDGEFINQDITNGRMEIWCAGLKIVKENILFGIGSENILNVAKEYLSDVRYQNLVNGGFHNSYISILVSSGVVGFLLYLVFIIMLIIDGLKYLWNNRINQYSLLFMMLFIMMANEIVEARWLYNTSYINIIFWIFSGIAVTKLKEEKYVRI